MSSSARRAAGAGSDSPSPESLQWWLIGKLEQHPKVMLRVRPFLRSDGIYAFEADAEGAAPDVPDRHCEGDAQSSQVFESKSVPANAGPASETDEIVAPGDCDDDVTPGEDSDSFEARVQALVELIEHEPLKAAEFVVAELAAAQDDPEWLAELVFAAEDLQFHGADIREAVRERLLGLAETLRHETQRDTGHVVWSALRCGASLLDASDIGRLRVFLDVAGTVDTRLVALQCVPRRFFRSPPPSDLQCESLVDRIAELGAKFLDPDMLVPGENAALAQNAVHALVVLGDPRSREQISRLQGFEKSWLTRQLRGKLQRTAESWNSDDTTGPSHPTRELLSESLDLLR